MTRDEQVAFCRKCQNRSFDPELGTICELTGKKADFQDTCKDFKLDETVTDLPAGVKEDLLQETVLTIEKPVAEILRKHEEFYFALVGGLVAVFIGAIIWAIITVVTQYQIGYMAVGVGLLVGIAVRFFGAGIDKKFGILGAGLALLGCLLGNLFSQIGFFATSESVSYLEIIKLLSPGIIAEVLIESFQPMDLLFYAIATYEGFRFAFRIVTKAELESIKTGTYDGTPKYEKHRIPLVLISVIALAGVLIIIFI
jgi:hypothetical protein